MAKRKNEAITDTTWTSDAHSKADYSVISDKKFVDTIKQYLIFSLKFKLNLLDKTIDELTFMEILNDNQVTKQAFCNEKRELMPQNWAEFKLNQLFKIDKGERLVKLERAIGEIPLLTASSYNNGISGYIDYDTFSESKKMFENRITVDMFCSVFYHDYAYFSDDNIHTLSFRNPDFEQYYENKYVNLFLVTIIKALTNKFDYGRQVRLKRFEEEIICLPSTSLNGTTIPDFGYMEQYIKGVAYSAAI